MGVAAMLVMCPGPFKQTFVPLSYGDSVCNLSSLCPVFPEEMFVNVDGRTDAGVIGIRLAHLTNKRYPYSGGCAGGWMDG